MKKIVSLIMVVLMSTLFFIGCGAEEKSNNQNVNQSEDSMLSQNEKDSYKEKAKEALKGLNISDIDILTQNGTKKPIVSVQVIFNKTNKKEVEEFAKEIKEKIEPISNLYDITILDKNNNVIATAGYENNEINFIE
ncbi:hypothetical protein ACHM2L_03930 [Clostridium perfringens]|uniref:hypothetical protein n=1 Tax=Clostridium perfringens TaxID=1502 RepID=UPI001CB42778|nr:hypothetical protein [Clostridium perfringens]ELP5177579.1 hypothetical protein [Clostridium perfringens]MDH5096732.1 hypothetical protein [Clostridium perfringens]UUR80122.1 hypothetical protein NQ196_09860 [Clostridium perfringens]HBI6977213.1 hypothetical protein [Clostridium perfringens]HBI7000075.1 hypothetical protein [Clostridium perfringens]